MNLFVVLWVESNQAATMATDRSVIKHHPQVTTNPEVGNIGVAHLVLEYTKLQYIHYKILHTIGLQ